MKCDFRASGDLVCVFFLISFCLLGYIQETQCATCLLFRLLLCLCLSSVTSHLSSLLPLWGNAIGKVNK